MLNLKKFSDSFAQSLFQRKLRKYWVKWPEKYRRYQKRCILKSIDVTDNGTKKYRVTVSRYFCTAVLPTYHGNIVLASKIKKNKKNYNLNI